MKNILVFGAGGFIGSHLIKLLKKQNHWVKGIDLKSPEFSKTHADEFVIGDLRDINVIKKVLDKPYDEVYQLAADMGGAGYIFTGNNDADILHNSAIINLNLLHFSTKVNIGIIFYSSSACIYPEFNQINTNNPVWVFSQPD